MKLIKNKKGEMLARDYFVILVLFGLLTGIGALIVADIASSDSGYDIENMTNENYKNRYDTLNKTSEYIGSMANETASSEGLSVASTYTTMFSATFNVIGTVFGSFGLVKDTGSYLMIDAGVPSALGNLVIGAIMALIIGILVFVIISSVSRGKL